MPHWVKYPTLSGPSGLACAAELAALVSSFAAATAGMPATVSARVVASPAVRRGDRPRIVTPGSREKGKETFLKRTLGVPWRSGQGARRDRSRTTMLGRTTT